mmetsp:Transcript_9959/g.37152  ORF Transcript_9959/g.37152 Transcript_9959/m.37152 type:complete len:186 (+) Transcript_9959:1498-2055(+)
MLMPDDREGCGSVSESGSHTTCPQMKCHLQQTRTTSRSHQSKCDWCHTREDDSDGRENVKVFSWEGFVDGTTIITFPFGAWPHTSQCLRVGSHWEFSSCELGVSPVMSAREECERSFASNVPLQTECFSILIIHTTHFAATLPMYWYIQFIRCNVPAGKSKLSVLCVLTHETMTYQPLYRYQSTT